MRPYFYFQILEFRAVNAAALWSADEVDHGELETTISTAFFAQAGDVDIVAESNTPVGVVKSCREDDSIHQDWFVKVAGETHPGTKLEGLIRSAIVEVKPKAITHIDFHRRALVEEYRSRNQDTSLFIGNSPPAWRTILV